MATQQQKKNWRVAAKKLDEFIKRLDKYNKHLYILSQGTVNVLIEIVLLVMACLALYLLRFQRELLNPKPLSLICLIFLLP